MTRTNGTMETRPRVIGRGRLAAETPGGTEGGLAGQLAVSVVVAHEDALPRDIIARACAQRHNLNVVECIATCDEMMARCLLSPPRVVITSDSISGEFDEVIERLLAVGTRVVAICTNPSVERVVHLLELGIHGVMLDDSSPVEIATGVQAVARGGVSLSPTVAVTLVQHWGRLRQDLARSDARIVRSLTPREAEVLEAMVEGLSTKAIARRLGVAYKTVENHKIRVFEKLQVRTHAQAVSVAIGRQMVPMGPHSPTEGFTL